MRLTLVVVTFSKLEFNLRIKQKIHLTDFASEIAVLLSPGHKLCNDGETHDNSLNMIEEQKNRKKN